MDSSASNAVYVDYNATTPVEASVVEAMDYALKHLWCNPSSNYDEALRTKKAIEESRRKVGQMINCELPEEEIVFTSGGTEANNWLFMSFIDEYCNTDTIPHVIASNIEHDSVTEPLKSLSQKSLLEVTFVPVSRETGTIEPEAVIAAVKANTVLVTVMLANNETGLIQNVSLIASLLNGLNKKRSQSSEPKIYLHSDAAQAIGKISVDVHQLQVDYLTIVGHKFYGPRIGALYCRKGAPLHPLFFGGGQERRLRPGTQNTACIVGLGEAANLVINNLDTYKKHFHNIRLYLEAKLTTTFRELVVINGKDIEDRLPNTVSVSFRDERLRGTLILKHATRVKASVGAACHSENIDEPSSVLIASGIEKELAICTLRLSVGRETSEREVDVVVKDLHKSVLHIIENHRSQT